MKYERKIYLECPECEEQVDEQTVKCTDIESDDLGQDIVTYVCPECGDLTKSLRRG